ncbi:MAG: ATP-dependent Clp protease proteolytic subunit [Bacteroidaceae bacterium]|jgi:ATP-dependent Clp protease protease subunit|nr:ATP-dependent Clp protease proteolytic subunit [Bacteroidaceae bacterium]
MEDLKDFRKFALSNTNVSPSALDDIVKKQGNMLTPYILEERQLNVATFDVFSRLMYDRIVYFTGVVNDDTCNTAVAQLLYLASVDERDINMYINSPGGSVVDGLGLVDTMNYINCDVSTLCIGMAASMGSVLLSNGAKGKRFVLPHSRVMIHQVSSSQSGTLADLEIEIEQTRRCKNDVYKILADNTGKTFEEMEALCDRNNWFIGQEAVDLGIVDKVLTKEKTE